MYIPLQILGILSVEYLLSNCAETECSNRYENQEDLLEAVPELRNCTAVRILYPICRQTVNVLYTLQPPYVVASKNGGDPGGLLPDILRVAIDVCCFGCLNVKFTGPVDYLQKFKHSDATLFMPLQSAFGSKQFAGRDYIPFLKVTGVTYLAKELSKLKKAHENTHHMMSSVISTWPLFITAILMAVTAGCVMWFLDTWFNEDDFPQRFPRGPFEGFWWAFVSMTTVGFGDRVPKSFIGRGFAILWIFLGITVFSMYTAVLTSALNIDPTIFENANFINKDVGVLSFTAAGESVVLEEHGNHVKFHNIDDMGKALQEDTISSIALDDNIARYYMHHLKKSIPSLKNHHHVDGLENSYGIVSYNSEITNFIRSFFETNEDQRNAILSRVLYDRWPNMKHEEVEADGGSFFSADSSVFIYGIVGLLVIAVISMLIGLTCKFVFYKKKDWLVKYTTCMEGEIDCFSSKVDPQGTEDNATIIANCIDELEEFSARWKTKLVTLSSSDGTPITKFDEDNL